MTKNEERVRFFARKTQNFHYQIKLETFYIDKFCNCMKIFLKRSKIEYFAAFYPQIGAISILMYMKENGSSTFILFSILYEFVLFYISLKIFISTVYNSLYDRR